MTKAEIVARAKATDPYMDYKDLAIVISELLLKSNSFDLTEMPDALMTPRAWHQWFEDLPESPQEILSSELTPELKSQYQQFIGHKDQELGICDKCGIGVYVAPNYCDFSSKSGEILRVKYPQDTPECSYCGHIKGQSIIK